VPTASPVGSYPTGIVAPTAFVSGSIRWTLPSAGAVGPKAVTQTALKVRLVSLALAGGLGALIWQLAGGRAIWEVLQGGSRLTGVLMVILALGLLIGFTVVFVAFHQVFFSPDTWTFRFEDTLIRLFPERFWQVAFGAVALASLVQAGLLWLASKAMIGRSA